MLYKFGSKAFSENLKNLRNFFFFEKIRQIEWESVLL